MIGRSIQIMTAKDTNLFNTLIRIENKDVFLDVKKNSAGLFLKMSERKDTLRKSIILPVSGIAKLISALDEVMKVYETEMRRHEIEDDRSIVGNLVYVKGLPWSTTEEQLALHFASAGSVTKATIIRRGRRGKIVSIGRGTVEFTSDEGATAAITMFDNTIFDGRVINCKPFRSTHTDSVSSKSTLHEGETYTSKVEKKMIPTKVYVKSLAWTTGEDQLRAFFSQVGSVLSASVRSTSKGKSAGSGIIEFSNALEAQRAIELLHQQTLDGRTIIVEQYYA